MTSPPPPTPSPWTISGPSLSHMRSWRLFAPLMLAMTEPQQQQQPKAGFLTCFWALDFLMFWAKTEHSILKENWVRNVSKHRNGPGILSLTNTLLFDGYKATQKQSGLKYPKMSHFHFARKINSNLVFSTLFQILYCFYYSTKMLQSGFHLCTNIFSSLSWILIWPKRWKIIKKVNVTANLWICRSADVPN